MLREAFTNTIIEQLFYFFPCTIFLFQCLFIFYLQLALKRFVERGRYMSKSVLDQALFLSAAVYQAVQKFRTGKNVLPSGYQLVTWLGGGLYPFIGYVMESKNRIIIVFRGTEDLFDIISDFDFRQVTYPFVKEAGKTHSGITSIYRKYIRSHLVSILQGLSKRKKLYITGHSLGGALATLAALDIAVNTKFNTPTVISFGSPRVGNSDFVLAFNQHISRSIRVVNINDFIPKFPPSNFFGIRYRHVKLEYPINFQNFSLFKNHEIIYYFNKLCSMNVEMCQKIRAKNPNFCPPSNTLGLNTKAV